MPKLINEFHNYMKRSNVRYALESLWAMLNAMLLTIVNALPAGRFRRAIGTWVTYVIVIIIIIAGAAILVTLVLFPGGSSTSTIYP